MADEFSPANLDKQQAHFSLLQTFAPGMHYMYINNGAGAQNGQAAGAAAEATISSPVPSRFSGGAAVAVLDLGLEVGSTAYLTTSRNSLVKSAATKSGAGNDDCKNNDGDGEENVSPC